MYASQSRCVTAAYVWHHLCLAPCAIWLRHCHVQLLQSCTRKACSPCTGSVPQNIHRTRTFTINKDNHIHQQSQQTYISDVRNPCELRNKTPCQAIFVVHWEIMEKRSRLHQVLRRLWCSAYWSCTERQNLSQTTVDVTAECLDNLFCR